MAQPREVRRIKFQVRSAKFEVAGVQARQAGRENRAETKRLEDLAAAYPISVVVPVYNSPYLLRLCLKALLANQRENVEWIVVDDASREDLSAAIESFSEEAEIRVIRHKRNKGPAAARNTGLAEARNDFILFVDADVEVPPRTIEWIRSTLRLYEHREDVAGVLGRYAERIPYDDFWTNYKNLATIHLYRMTDTISPYLHTPIFCVRREVIESAGGFDAGFATAEDFRLGVVLGSRGNRFIIDRRIRGTHHKRYTLDSILREDARRLHDLSRLGFKGREKGFAYQAHRPTRILSALLPGITLITVLAALAAEIPLWLPLLPLAIFAALNLPQLKFFRKCRGRKFALKGGLFLFVEMLYAQYRVFREFLIAFLTLGK